MCDSCVKVTTFQHIDSTNEEAKRRIRNGGITDPFVIVSESQSYGKGSYGRKWYSEANGGLYYTYAASVKNESFLSDLSFVTQLAYILAPTVESLANISLTIKLPNDFILSGKKVGGILIETLAYTHPESVTTGRRLRECYMVVGMGLNLNQTFFPEDLKDIATSLYIETGRRYAKEPVIKKITDTLTSFFKQYEF